jgi:hypothetical protein
MDPTADRSPCIKVQKGIFGIICLMAASVLFSRGKGNFRPTIGCDKKFVPGDDKIRISFSFSQ